MKKIYRWKFLKRGFRSEYGNFKWKIGKWNKIDGKLSMCKNGFHCSRNVYDAFSYVRGEILARVECGGDYIIENDKECWEEMRVVKAYKWTKKDSVAIAIYAARLVLPIFEKIYPNDKRPRKAIEAAVNWLKNPTEKNRIAAKMAAKAADAATEKAYKMLGSVKMVEAADASVIVACAAGRKNSIKAMSDLYRELIAVWLASKTAIKKIKTRFNKQVKELKEIKNERVG